MIDGSIHFNINIRKKIKIIKFKKVKKILWRQNENGFVFVLRRTLPHTHTHMHT